MKVFIDGFTVDWKGNFWRPYEKLQNNEDIKVV